MSHRHRQRIRRHEPSNFTIGDIFLFGILIRLELRDFCFLVYFKDSDLIGNNLKMF
jgi:hypothetical protein